MSVINEKSVKLEPTEGFSLSDEPICGLNKIRGPLVELWANNDSTLSGHHQMESTAMAKEESSSSNFGHSTANADGLESFSADFAYGATLTAPRGQLNGGEQQQQDIASGQKQQDEELLEEVEVEQASGLTLVSSRIQTGQMQQQQQEQKTTKVQHVAVFKLVSYPDSEDEEEEQDQPQDQEQLEEEEEDEAEQVVGGEVDEDKWRDVAVIELPKKEGIAQILRDDPEICLRDGRWTTIFFSCKLINSSRIPCHYEKKWNAETGKLQERRAHNHETGIKRKPGRKPKNAGEKEGGK